jgi:hypothetical protein
MPGRRGEQPTYVCFTHGFRYVRHDVGMVDLPSGMLEIDARTGELIAETRIDGPDGEVPAAMLDSDALGRLSREVDQLAPAFFDGESAVPASLAAVADQYRKDVRVAIQPEFLPFYKKYAGEWYQWVGL